MKIDILDKLHRHDIGTVLNEHGLVGEAVEVGAAYGGFSLHLLHKWHGRKLTLVDLWARQDPEVYRERTGDVNYGLWYDCCLKLAEEDPRVRLLRMDSVKAANEFAPESLDFVYIDANHSYEAVTADLQAWYPKVKKGGIFGGHDFYDRTDKGHWCFVKSAVKDWADKHPEIEELWTTPCSSWWTDKL